jgi:hypothetical protein
MAMQISLIGPHHDGQPKLSVRATGNYAPDVFDDLKNRIVQLYLELFMDVEEATEADDATVAGIGTDDGEAATT